MNGLPLHPAVVHIPVALAMLIPLLAIGLLALTWRKPSRNALVLLLAAQAGLVASGFVAMSTGEETEEVVERVVAKTYIHEHEERAELFVWVGAAGLVVAGAALALAQKRRASAARVALGRSSRCPWWWRSWGSGPARPGASWSTSTARRARTAAGQPRRPRPRLMATTTIESS